jgi:hypothetical protein
MLLPSATAFANWTATGRFLYVDRAYDQTGFTGAEPQLAVRSADVHILDSKNKILASTVTDANGNFSVLVVDTSTRTVYARVTSKSANTPGLFIEVRNTTGNNWNNYAVKSANVSNHGPNTNYNFGTIVALKGQGGEAFNIYDQMLRGVDYIAFLRGSRPGSADNLIAAWAINRGVTDSVYNRFTRTLNYRDTAGYDDTPILHEMGHYFVAEFSATDGAAGSHTFSDCNVDLKLAWEEGFATYWGNSVLRNLNMSGCNIYMRSNGGPGPGNLVRYADLETDTQYLCRGDASEVSVFSFLWDIDDSASTPDSTPGIDDAQDSVAQPDSQVWEVMRDYMPTAVNKSMEDFWDGWFKAPISNGLLAELSSIAGIVGVDFSEDASEVNNSAATAALIAVGSGPTPATLFYDPDGDGAGQADTDYYVFSATAGQLLRAETTNLISDGNTLLELLDSDGATVLTSNDDRAVGDPSSLINWTAPRSDVFYLRVTHAPDLGIYGSYSLTVTPL